MLVNGANAPLQRIVGAEALRHPIDDKAPLSALLHPGETDQGGLT